MAAKIQNKKQQIFTLAGILVFTDKVIDKETANRIRRIEKGYSTEEITSLILNYSQNDVESLRKEVLTDK